MAPSAPADPSATTSATATAQAGMGLDSIRLQAEEHPVIEDAAAT